MNMIETVLESSRLRHSENTYIMGLFSIFFGEFAKTYFQKKIKHLEISQFWRPKMNLKKFLKTCKGKVLVSYGKNVSSRRVFCQLSLFLLTRAFDRWQLECHTTSQKFLQQEIKLFLFFSKWFKRPLQNSFKIQSLRNVRNFDKSGGKLKSDHEDSESDSAGDSGHQFWDE